MAQEFWEGSLSGTAWVTVAVTDRSESVRALLLDVVQQCRDVGARLAILILENSTNPTHRRANQATTSMLQAAGTDVDLIDRPPYRRSIAESRERQRAWVQRRLSRVGAPSFIWMLDDDNRLDHLYLDDELLCHGRLEHHIARLFHMAGDPNRPDLLVGEVCGDPPIPPVATVASRLTDLERNLELLGWAHSDDRAADTLSVLPIARDFDAYYDFSEERSEPSWSHPCRWLSRNRQTSCRQELVALVSEARHLMSGIGLTRPILAVPHRLAWLGPGVRRGGNAVFFSANACVEHTYPSLSLGSVHSRRGDMVGAALLSRRYDIRTGGFSVRHVRTRDLPIPSAESLTRSIVADTLGAALARGISSEAPERSIGAFLDRRAETIDSALQAATQIAGRVVRLVDTTDRLREHAPSLREMLSWVLRELPIGSRGRGVRAALESRESRRAITDEAIALQLTWEEVA